MQQRGHNGFSFDDVALLVGIKKPSIHHHFSTKAELACVVAQRYTHRFRAALLEIEGRSARAPERLAGYAALFEQTFAVDKRLCVCVCVCGMLGAEAQSLPPEVSAQVQRFFEANLAWLTQVMAEGQAAGSIRPQPEAGALAEALLCALEGAMVVGRGLASPRSPQAVGVAMIFTLLA
jgi:TetR/AcrR family transcriptional repressor of nem operon